MLPTRISARSTCQHGARRGPLRPSSRWPQKPSFGDTASLGNCAARLVTASSVSSDTPASGDQVEYLAANPRQVSPGHTAEPPHEFERVCERVSPTWSCRLGRGPPCRDEFRPGRESVLVTVVGHETPRRTP
uniref:Orf9 n=1 Tax=Saccharopolyspora spinosa TaxID=60894 RepID=Q6JHQ8_SACSN|nr:Orf9 [Saccharopolyspora spinosa NRRL 18395]